MSKRRGSLFILASSYSNIVFSVISGLFFVPLYLQYFSSSLYGAWLATGNIVALVGMLEGGIHIVLSQKLSKAFELKLENEFEKSVFSGLLINVCTFLLITITCLVVSPYVGGWVNANPEDTAALSKAFIIAGFATGLYIITSSFSVICQSWHKNEFSTISYACGSFFGLTATFLLLVFFKQGILSIAIGNLVRVVTIFVLMSMYTINKWGKLQLNKPHFDKINLKDLIKKTLPVLSGNISVLIFNNSKEFLVAALINPTVSTIISVSGRIYSLIIMFANPLAFSIYPSLSSFSADKEKFKKNAVKGMQFHLALVSFFYLIALSVNKSFVTLWVGAENYGGFYLSLFLCCAGMFQARSVMISIVLNAVEQFKSISYIRIASMAIRLVLLFIMVKVFIVQQNTIPVIDMIGELFLLFMFQYVMHKKFIDVHVFKTSLVSIIAVLVLGGIFDFLLADYLNTWIKLGIFIAIINFVTGIILINSKPMIIFFKEAIGEQMANKLRPIARYTNFLKIKHLFNLNH